MRITICDEDAGRRDSLEKVIGKFFLSRAKVDFDICNSKELKRNLEKKTYLCDILIMYVSKESCDEAFELIREMNERFSFCQVIVYCTRSEYSYHPEFSRVNLCGWFCTEDMNELLPGVLQRAADMLDYEEARCMVCKVGKEIIKIPFNKIYFLEREQHTTKIYTKEGVYPIRRKLSELEEEFVSYPPLIRCHTSYFVNLTYAMKYDGKTFEMENKEVIPISRKYTKSVREILCKRNKFLR